MSEDSKELYEFGPFRLDVDEHTLVRSDGIKNGHLPEKAFKTLSILVRHSGHLLSKEELLDQIWPDSFVEENNLDKCIHTIRHALGEKPGELQYIETVRKHGYRFVAPVISLADTTVSSNISLDKTYSSKAVLYPVSNNSLQENAYFTSNAINNGRVADHNSLAVLPLVNFTGDAENDYFCDGLAEQLANALSRIANLKVAARTSAFAFRHSKATIGEIGRLLSVSLVLEGSLRKSEDSFRIAVQLVDSITGYQIWSDSYDWEMKDIFDVQDEITMAVINALKLKLLTSNTTSVLKRHTLSSDAYHQYLKGRFFWNTRTPDGFQKSIDYFHQATKSDSHYALAYSGLADCYSVLGFYEILSPNDAKQKANQAVSEALRTDPDLGEAYASLGLYNSLFEWDWAGSEQAFSRAFEIIPNYAAAHLWHGVTITSMQRFDDALAEVGIAQELDPLSPVVNAYAALTLYFARRYDEAITQSQKAIEIAPDNFLGHWTLGVVYGQKQMYQEAISELGAAGNIQSELARTYARSGRTAEAKTILEELNKLSKERYVSPVALAIIYVGLREKETVFSLLEEAFNERSARLQWFLTDPANIDYLEGDARFGSLLQRMQLPSTVYSPSPE